MHNTVNTGPVKEVTRRMSTSAQLVMGAIQGRCDLPAHVTACAARLADEFFTRQEALGWSGDPVETYAETLWLKRGGATWQPNVSHLGLQPTGS